MPAKKNKVEKKVGKWRSGEAEELEWNSLGPTTGFNYCVGMPNLEFEGYTASRIPCRGCKLQVPRWDSPHQVTACVYDFDKLASISWPITNTTLAHGRNTTRFVSHQV
jgi:hypothetical protein